MKASHWPLALGLLALVPTAGLAPGAVAQPNTMGFFVTSSGSGQGADLGGLAGADARCQSLAQAAGAGGRTWRAYLSTSGAGGVNARDRIGRGPWRNAKGEVIANSVAELHGSNALTLQTALTEKGEPINGRRSTPNTHDVLTGSQPDGTAFAGAEDRTCRNWTYSGAEGAAMVGHHDREGLRDDDASKSWNSSHPTRGCGQEALKTTGGAGLFYCFAAD